jgi:hypothetical protein
MKVALAPFAVAGQRLSTVTVVLGVRQPIPAAAAKGRITETTELVTSAFTPEGDPRGSQRHTARVTLRAGSDGDASYEVLGRIDLPPGRYRLRMAAHNATSGRTGSVFADVVVPDYSDAAASLSPVVLGATPGLASAPRDLFSKLLPFVPTSERTFTKADRVTSLLRLYQSGRRTVERADVVIRIRDASNIEVASETRTIAADRFTAAGESLIVQTPPPVRPAIGGRAAPPPSPSADAFANLSLRSADVQYALPISRLPPGMYLLTFEVTMGTSVMRRDVRFEVK